MADHLDIHGITGNPLAENNHTQLHYPTLCSSVGRTTNVKNANDMSNSCMTVQVIYRCIKVDVA